MFAACGTPLVAARGGTVTKAAHQSSAGNYVVITDEARRSYAYMHMRKAALVSEGERVETGQPIGEVGETGRASGCHLHFELWTAPGWYAGGKPIDPLPQLKQWDAAA
jgi:murein DD-endopeptidase MepM/ murein hydrolase activator NlpD